jgi:WD40 repeat protein
MRYRAIAFTLITLHLLASFHMVTAQSHLEFRKLLQLGRGSVNTISWNPNASMFAVGGSRGIWLYDAETFAPLKQLTSQETNSLRWLPNGEQLATKGLDGAVIYDTNTGTQVVHFPAEMNFGEWSRDGEQWAVGNQVWRVTTRQRIMGIDGYANLLWNGNFDFFHFHCI